MELNNVVIFIRRYLTRPGVENMLEAITPTRAKWGIWI